MKIKLSKSQWEMMGKKSGWMKEAVVSPIQSNSPYQVPPVLYVIDNVIKGLTQAKGEVQNLLQKNPKATAEEISKTIATFNSISQDIANYIAKTSFANVGKEMPVQP